jgi:hypothetical protein
MQKPVVFLYTNYTHADKEIRKTIWFIIASMLLPGNNTNQEGERPLQWKLIFEEETEEDPGRWKDLPSLWMGRISTVTVEV